MLTATVSGSFHRHMEAVTKAVYELHALGVRVLSPADPRVVASKGEFLFVASDPTRSVRLVQDRHLESIRCANFLWLVCPDGYVGQSAAMEIGFAAGAGVRIFATHSPADLTLREYVEIVPNISAALLHVATAGDPLGRQESILIEPRKAIDESHDGLEKIRTMLLGGSGLINPAPDVWREVRKIRTLLRLPSTIN